MNKEYVIISDNTCDLPDNIYKQLGLKIMCLSYTMGGVEYSEDNALSISEFYAKMREGEMTKTSQITREDIEKTFTEALNNGFDILYIGFSSGLSGSYDSARIAAEELSPKYPDSKIRTVDSLCASIGEGLFVYKAAQMKKEGKSIDEVYQWCEDNKLHLCHMFTVNDLMFLHRGGRVSKASAIAGSILGIKPILHVDNEGHLIPIGKIRGRKQSLEALVNEMDKRLGNYKNDTIGISHGDCIEDAEYVKKLIEKKYGIKNFIINHVGPVIGSHSGPGTIALFFLGEYR
ncbi:MAG TPA: DegV family protein [Oscillospiraceae bacterium]|nr:DegV family protein [Oscillospiraceae bacterium]